LIACGEGVRTRITPTEKETTMICTAETVKMAPRRWAGVERNSPLQQERAVSTAMISAEAVTAK
jgi:hypothetical protein